MLDFSGPIEVEFACLADWVPQGIGELNGAVATGDIVVGRVQSLSLPAVRNRHDGTFGQCARPWWTASQYVDAAHSVDPAGAHPLAC